MAIDQLIAAGVQPATQLNSPLQTIGGLMQLRGQMSEIALRQAQVEQAKQQQQLIQVEQQQKNRDLSDVNNYTALIKDPAVQTAFNGNGDVSAFQKAGIQPKFIDELVKSRQDKLQGAMTLDKDTLANRATALGQLKDTAVNLAAPDADGKPADMATINSRYQSAREGLAPLLKMAGFDGPLPASLASPDQLNQVISTLHGSEALYGAALAHKKEQAETAKNQSTADIDNFKLNLMKGMDANTVASGVDALIDPMKYPQANKDAHAAAAVARLSGDPAKVAEAVKSVYDEQVGKPAGAAATEVAKTGPELDKARKMIPIEAAAAGARSAAETPAMVNRAVQTQQALAKLSPDAFATIPDATSRREAMNESDKIDKEYTDKVGASLQLLDTIRAAQNGNKAAPGVIPIEQVRSVLSNGRVNQAELKGVSSQAGSLMDHIEGWVKGKAEGEPIPPDILRDTAALALIQQQAAKRTYDAGLDRLKKRGVDTSKISAPSMSVGGTSQTIRARDPQGKLHEAAAGTALPAGWKLEP